MNELPPLMRDQRKIDSDHLRLLGIFHFVLAGLSAVGIGFLFLHYTLMHLVMANPGAWKDAKGNGPNPEQFLAIFKWFYLVFGSMIIAGGVLILLSGLFIRRRINRVFSLVVAGLDCAMFPFGTALGVFTLVVLLRDSVRDAYEPARGA